MLLQEWASRVRRGSESRGPRVHIRSAMQPVFAGHATNRTRTALSDTGAEVSSASKHRAALHPGSRRNTHHFPHDRAVRAG